MIKKFKKINKKYKLQKIIYLIFIILIFHKFKKNTSKVANVLEKFEMLWEFAEKPQNYKLFDGKRIVDTNYASTTKVLLQPHETDFGNAPKEWADVGVMVPVLECTYGDTIMGIAKYEPKFVHGRKVKQKFDWTNVKICLKFLKICNF